MWRRPIIAGEHERQAERARSSGLTGPNGMTMSLRIAEESMALLGEHADIPIAFRVDRVLLASTPSAGLGGITFTETPVESPWIKDYDAIDGEGPTRWVTHFDTSQWGLLAAHDDDLRVGGAVIAFRSADVHMLEGRSDLAVLWDLRVRPEVRSSGVGAALFHAAEEWSLARGCRTLRVETQNVNVPACRFYARMGCTLGAINLFAYPQLPAEAQMIWVKELADATRPRVA